MASIERENRLRAAAFSWLDDLVLRDGPCLDYARLRRGFPFEGRAHPVIHQKGIYKPAGSSFALTLKTSSRSSRGYADRFDGEDALLYSMQDEGPSGDDNRAVIAACQASLPLIYLSQVRKTPARFAVVYPVWVTDVLADRRLFRIEVQPHVLGRMDDKLHGASVALDASPLRRYVERAYGVGVVRRRLHQAAFRDQVLEAYEQQCAMCRLPVPSLLDAAHIVPDSELRGDPVVSNGLSLCRIHHRAFDLHLVAVDPASTRVHVHRELLDQADGPVLKHGFHALHGAELFVPSEGGDRPDPARLGEHWNAFLQR